MNPQGLSDALFLTKLIATLSLIGNLVVLGMQIFGRPQRIQTHQPFKVVAGDEALPRKEFDLIHGQIVQDVRGLRHDFDVLRAELVDLKSDVSAMRATAEAHAQMAASVGAKLDRLVERMPAKTA